MSKVNMTKKQSKLFLCFLGFAFIFLVRKYSKYELNNLDIRMIVHILFSFFLLLKGTVKSLATILEPEENEENKYEKYLKILNNKVLGFFLNFVVLALLIISFCLLFFL